MQISLLRGPVRIVAPRCSRDGAEARRERGEDRIKPTDRIAVAADHQAVAAVETPDAATRAHIQIMKTARLEFFRAPNVVDVVGIASIDDGIAWVKPFDKAAHDRIDDRRRDHHPDRPRRSQFGDQIVE